MFRITITHRAEKDLKKLDRNAKNRIVKMIVSLADEPRPLGCSKILSEKGVWRIRIGDYRVLYFADAKTKQIVVGVIGHRREVYRN